MYLIFILFPGVPDVKSDQRIYGEDRRNPREAPDRDGEREWSDSSDTSPVICRSLISWMLVLYKTWNILTEETFQTLLPDITLLISRSDVSI